MDKADKSPSYELKNRLSLALMSAERLSGLIQVSVFPLAKVALFPSTTKPLNIFEPRYIAMINDALEENGLIALAFQDPAASRAQNQGVLGHIRTVAGVGRVQLVEKRSDGTMLILLHAIGKVQLENALKTDLPYLRAEARWIEEDKALSDNYLFILTRLMRDLGRWLSIHIPSVDDRQNFLQQLHTQEEKINAICSLMVLDAEVQQALLEVNSLNERCSQLVLSIEGESPAQ
jgi:Lon protease-like protein